MAACREGRTPYIYHLTESDGVLRFCRHCRRLTPIAVRVYFSGERRGTQVTRCCVCQKGRVSQCPAGVSLPPPLRQEDHEYTAVAS